jgi:hypothetical protein
LLPDADENQIVKNASGGSVMSTSSGKFILKTGRKIRTLASPM